MMVMMSKGRVAVGVGVTVTVIMVVITAVVAMMASLLECRPHDGGQCTEAAAGRGQVKDATMGSCRAEDEMGR